MVTGISSGQPDMRAGSMVVHASELFWVRRLASVLNSTAREIILTSVSFCDGLAHSHFCRFFLHCLFARHFPAYK